MFKGCEIEGAEIRQDREGDRGEIRNEKGKRGGARGILKLRK